MYVMGIVAANVRTSTEGPEYALGTLGAVVNAPTVQSAAIGVTGGSGGSPVGPKVFVYVKSAAGVTSGHVVLMDEAFDVVSASATTGATAAGAGKLVGVAQGTIAANGYGWVQIYGGTTCLVVAATAVKTVVTLSGTAGALDDLTAVGSLPLMGIYLSAVNSTTGTVFLNYPHIGPAITA